MIQIKEKACKKMKEYVQQMGDTEIGGLLIGKINGEDLIIKDAILLKQEATLSTFEISDEALMDLTKNAEPKFLESIIGWWHSHGNGSTFWSGVDDRTFERLREFIGLCFGIVLSNGEHRLNMRSRLDIGYNGNKLSIDDIRPEVDWLGKVKLNVKHIQREIEQKVSIQKLQHYEDDEFFQFYNDKESELPETNRAN